MQLKTKVIVTGVSNLHDARYCAGMGVDFIGFPIEESQEGYVNQADFKEIVEWLSGPKFLAEVSDGHGVDLMNYPIDGLITDNLDLIGKTELPTILRIRDIVDSEQIMERYASLVEAFLLEVDQENIDATLQTKIQELAAKYTLYLGFGVTKDNVNELLESVKLSGIGLKGSKEIKVGYNDFDGLADVLEEIEVY